MCCLSWGSRASWPPSESQPRYFFSVASFRSRSLLPMRESRSPLPRLWTGEAIVFVAGMWAHLHSIRQSFNTDEASSVIHALSHWWAPFDTRFGWQIHIGGGTLLARIGMGLFGEHDWAARIPAATASSVGLALVYRWLRRRFDSTVAILTVGFICSLPLWAEQAALARGYGLSFLAGALVIPAAWDVLDGRTTVREARLLAGLFVGSLIGFLSAFFFLFLALGVVAVDDPGSVVPCRGLALCGHFSDSYRLECFTSRGCQRRCSRVAPYRGLPWFVVPGRFVEALGFDLSSALAGDGVRERWFVAAVGIRTAWFAWANRRVARSGHRSAMAAAPGLFLPAILHPPAAAVVSDGDPGSSLPAGHRRGPRGGDLGRPRP